MFGTFSSGVAMEIPQSDDAAALRAAMPPEVSEQIYR